MALTPVLLALGTMSLSSIATSLIVLAGSFTVIGAAGLALSPITPALIGLSAAIALVGAGCLAAGAGVLAFSTGLTALAVAFTASGAAIVTGIKELLNLIPLLAENIGKGIVAMATAIGNGSEAIGEAFKKIVLSITASLTECIPAIAEGVLKIITEVLTSLAAHTPQIVDSIFEFLIGILEGVARNLPSLIQSAVNVLMSFFTGIVDAIKSIDTSALLKGIAGIGLMAGIMAALGAVAGLIPGAMVGVLGMGAVIAELALVLAAVGGLAQIPGLSWLIDEGGKLLQGIGTAIGSFVGGIVGGFMGGISSQFPQIGADLSAFMTNARPFIEGVSSIDSSVMSGMASLAGAILTLTAANVLEGLTSWFTGGTSLAAFGAELAAFAPYFKAYYDSINSIDGSVVEASANAALALAEFASKIPNSGGLAAVFAGENSLSAFADELIVFGPKLKAYADSVSGLNADVVTNSANAALALAEFASKLPNSGGAVSWFAGNNDLSEFAEELCKFGPGLKKYADSVSGLNGDVVVNSANAASALAELASNLPNSGGVVSWFTGDNEIDKFGSELAAFGPKFKEYADSISGLDAGVVTNSANAASALSALANSLPNSGGVVSWFTGDNDIAAFGESLSSFGACLKTYYDHVSGIDITQLSAATNELSHLSSVLSGIGTINSDAVSSFGKALSSIADSGVKSFITSINNATSQVQQAASDLITAFVNAVNAKKDTVTSTFSGVTSSIVTTMNASKSSFTTVGDNIVKGVANGITDTTFYAEAKARAMARAAYNAACEELGIHSPSLEFQYIGEMIGKGLEKGIVKSGQDAIDASTDVADTLTSASEKSYDDLTKWISDNEYFGKISLDEELYVWRKFQSRYEQGTDERMKADKEIYRLIQEISKADYQHSMDWISDQKSKNELSLQEELAAYERMQSRFEWGSEERKNIDKEIYRLRNELVTESYQHSLDWIENEKYHNRLSLEEELAAYERMHDRDMNGDLKRGNRLTKRYTV